MDALEFLYKGQDNQTLQKYSQKDYKRCDKHVKM